jgi:IS30 family transposase
MGQGSRRAHRLTGAERLELQLRVRAGETHEVVATAVGCSAEAVQRVLVKTGGVKPRSTPQSASRLSLSEREEISRRLLAGDSCRRIARRFDRSLSTVSRDVAAAGHRERYRARRADEAAHRRAHRPKIAKLLAAPRLRRAVERGLRLRWSPQQITARLILDHPDGLEKRVSHETIYQSLFVQGCGALREELTRCLRTGGAQRRRLNRATGSGQLRHMVLISERPAEIEDRAVLATGKAT